MSDLALYMYPSKVRVHVAICDTSGRGSIDAYYHHSRLISNMARYSIALSALYQSEQVAVI